MRNYLNKKDTQMEQQNLSIEETKKLERLVTDGVSILSQVQVLKEGLKESVDEIAEELEIKPALLNRAIRMAYTAEFNDKKAEMDTVEYILDAVGRKL